VFPQFIQNNFVLTWFMTLGICLSGFAAMAWWRIRTGPTFPPLSTVNVLHRERFASGRSHYSLITKLGGAQNALAVVLTDADLWITTFSFFRGIAGFYDLDHRIPISRITNVENRGKAIFVQFQKPDGDQCKIELRLRGTHDFLSCLRSLMDAHNEQHRAKEDRQC
jgi:hypothetical protein